MRASASARARLAAPDRPLRPGARAPGFELRATPYSTVRLDDLRGRPVVLAFYVADWHPVAADQLAQLEALSPELQPVGAHVLGISVDGTWSHSAFARERSLSFPLLADDSPPGAVADAYGVLASESGRSRRALFVIDADGVVRWSGVFPDAVTPGVDGVLSALEALDGRSGSRVARRVDGASDQDVA